MLFGGNVAKVDIKPSRNPKNANVPEYYGTVTIAADNGYWDVKANNGQGAWHKAPVFIEVKVDNRILKKFKGGLNIGDQVLFKGFIIQDNWLNAQQAKEYKIRMKAEDVLGHVTKSFINAAKQAGMKDYMRNLNVNTLTLAGNISKVEIYESKDVRNTNNTVEYFGTITVAVDNGYFDNNLNNGQGSWKEITAFIDVKVDNRIINRFKDGIDIGSEVCFVGHVAQDSWKDKESGQNRSQLRMKADNVNYYLSKAERECLKANGFIGNNNQSQQNVTSTPQQQGGFAQQQVPAQQGGFTQQQAQQGGFAPAQQQAPAKQGGFQNTDKTNEFQKAGGFHKQQ